MKKILVFSDSHGKNSDMISAIESHKDANVIVFLGDGERDFDDTLAACDLDFGGKEKGVEILRVRGNCDWGSGESDRIITDFEGVKTLITHGHVQGVKSGYGTLIQLAREKECRLVLFGHTHFALAEDRYGIMIINPGSIESGEYALVTIDGEKITYKLY
jgi:putative phosphoesterase